MELLWECAKDYSHYTFKDSHDFVWVLIPLTSPTWILYGPAMAFPFTTLGGLRVATDMSDAIIANHLAKEA